MSEPRTPATAAGRALAERMTGTPTWMARAILAIEAEARETADYECLECGGRAEARAPLDVERLREAVDAALFDAEMDDSHPGCRAKWRRVAMGAFDAATSA